MVALSPALPESSMKATYLGLATYLGAALVVWYLIASLRVAFKKGLRKLPGPFLARVSGLYRLSLVQAGKAPVEYRKVHEKYGPIVRVGPNHVSISDPAAIPQIYGIGSSYIKVTKKPLICASFSA